MAGAAVLSPWSIAGIGKQNPAAHQALRDRRAVNEGRILDGKYTFDDVQEFARSASTLRMPQPASLYFRLKAKGSATAKARQHLMNLIWQDFAQEKKYEEN